MKLSIFDLDGTLLRPSGRWNDDVAEKAHAAIKRGDYVVLLTGRPTMQAHTIKAAAQSRDLPFHEVITVGPLNTLDRKKRQIVRLVAATRPAIVELWDDQQDMLADYGAMLKLMGVTNRLHRVR